MFFSTDLVSNYHKQGFSVEWGNNLATVVYCQEKCMSLALCRLSHNFHEPKVNQLKGETLS